MPAYQGCLFAKVRVVAGNYSLSGNVALPAFTSRAINPTAPRANAALFQYYPGFLSPSL